MAKAPHIGFDIGTGELKIALCDGGSVKFLAEEAVPENLVREGRIVSFDAMADFVRECARKHRIYGRDCAVVLSAGQAFLRRLSLPAMTVDQLQVNLPYEFRDYLTQGKDQYFYDYAVNELRGGEEGAPEELDLTAAAVPKEVIRDYTEMFRRAGFKLRAAAPPECAYANLIAAHEARHPEAAGEEYCILDLGHAATRVHIFTGSRFEATRVIEYGSALVDQAIGDALNVDEYVARTYKEANHEGAQELEGPKGVYGSIAVEIMKAVNFYGFNNRESNLQNAYYCGGGARIPALLEAISHAVSLSLHRIDALMPGGAGEGALPALCAGAVGITQQ